MTITEALIELGVTEETLTQEEKQFLDEQGELKPHFQPPPLVASFMQEPGVSRREHLPVPRGPVEIW